MGLFCFLHFCCIEKTDYYLHFNLSLEGILSNLIGIMKKKFFALLLIFIPAFHTKVQTAPSAFGTKWFEDARFGLFVHFGPYSVLGAGEWVMNTRPIRAASYRRLQDFFNPKEFNAKEWVRIAKNAGMKYITFTARHHDSFSNWDTKQSDWNIMNTPYGKDLIKQLADECQKEGIVLNLYYSTVDWMRPDYQWETGRSGQHSGRVGPSNWDGYINFMKAQLTELLTDYGPIGVIWLDGHWDQTDEKNRSNQQAKVDWRYAEIYELIHRLQPNCLIANNHHLPPFPGENIQVFERDVPGENKAGYSGQKVSGLPLETCQTINDSWGFSITDDHFKSAKELIHLLVRTAGTGANLLLNVGPMPNGKIQPECVERLEEVGKWLQKWGFTIYATQRGFTLPQDWGAVTRKGNTYYIHILKSNTTNIIVRIPEPIKSCQWINVSGTVQQTRRNDYTWLRFEAQLDDVDAILAVEVQ